MDSGIPPSDDILQRALQKAAVGNSEKTRLAIPARYVLLAICLTFTNDEQIQVYL